jgi:hypothetical protein
MRTVVTAVTFAVLLAGAPAAAQEAHDLEDTRLLRKLTLTLLDRAASVEEYEALLALPPGDRPEALEARIDEILSSDEFRDQLVRWGHGYLGVSRYEYLTAQSTWGAGFGILFQPCPDGTLHAGALGIFNDNYPRFGNPTSLCDDPDATLRAVEPWWAAGTTVSTIGDAGTENTESEGVDCGIPVRPNSVTYRPEEGCSCGPNLIYCSRSRGGLFSGFVLDYDGSAHQLHSQRRALFEEPARLFAHVIAENRPFTDIVLGSTTVVNQGLFQVYRRAARQSPANRSLDEDEWWREWADPTEWREVPTSVLHPNLLASRDTRFDPRVEDGGPPGLPAAGVLTTMGANDAFPRERVRAARWTESLTCREFSPPSADVQFNAYRRDPGTEGVCQHCHQIIDPAAIHFKRAFGGGGRLGGLTGWQIDDLVSYDADRVRWETSYNFETLLTPVTEERIFENTDARFLDFLPPEERLFGEQSDSTIGPLGFAKLIVASGEFDRCAVMRSYERFGGRRLARGQDDPLIDALLAVYMDADKRLLPVIRHILTQPRFRQGW